ncbi:hypothetical protein [Spongiimicrobium salis]|uniref:hypothetical protein n=1 Tax=Spongiimicrobium salis TaxID=1667022 RepID=UPI00374DC092
MKRMNTDRFTTEELEFIKAKCFELTPYRIGKLLERDAKSVASRCKIFKGLKREEYNVGKSTSHEVFMRIKSLQDNIVYLESKNKRGKLDKLITINKNMLSRLQKI